MKKQCVSYIFCKQVGKEEELRRQKKKKKKIRGKARNRLRQHRSELEVLVSRCELGMRVFWSESKNDTCPGSWKSSLQFWSDRSGG